MKREIERLAKTERENARVRPTGAGERVAGRRFTGLRVDPEQFADGVR